MSGAALSREEVFMQMRHAGARQLGEVERAYIELDGKVSTFMFSPREVRPGLPLVPPWYLIHERPKGWQVGDPVPDSGVYTCRDCGETAELEAGKPFPRCPSCEGKEWTLAVCQPRLEQEAD
jgi:hypothetical protein